jgi:hypothetical protein
MSLFGFTIKTEQTKQEMQLRMLGAEIIKLKIWLEVTKKSWLWLISWTYGSSYRVLDEEYSGLDSHYLFWKAEHIIQNHWILCPEYCILNGLSESLQ